MKQITLLDGGLGQEINSRADHQHSHPLWSVKVMHDQPELVIDVHKDFIRAGAKVLGLNNYTATITRMTRHQMGDMFDATHKLAIELMTTAIDQSGIDRKDINIAGCLPPLAASYVASEAHGYQRSFDEYCQLIEIQEAGVELFLVETISNIEEAEAAIDALAEFDQPAYIGLTLADKVTDAIDDEPMPRLRSGERLDEAVQMLSDKQVTAAMINCSFPEIVSLALPVLARSGLVFGGYANGFTSIDGLVPGGTVDTLHARCDLSPSQYADYVFDWIDAGATIIGGCCEISPEHIGYLHDRMIADDITPVKLV